MGDDHLTQLSPVTYRFSLAAICLQLLAAGSIRECLGRFVGYGKNIRQSG